MPTELLIASWRASGLRCPDYEVDLLDKNGNPHPVSLIQMPNGAGKTTTLELLRAALSGAAQDGQWEPRKVMSLRKHGSKSTEGEFQVVLLCNGKRVTITMRFDFDTGTVSYKTTSGSTSGMKHGFHPPVAFQRFLRPDFVNFFVFDGELADKLLNHDHTNAQSAIEDLFQLKTLTLMKSRLQDFWQALLSKNGAGEERGLTRRRNRVEFLRDWLGKLREKHQELIRSHDSTKRSLIEKTNKFQKAINSRDEFRDRLHKAEIAFKDAETNVSRTTKEALALMRSPHCLSAVLGSAILALKDNLDKAKLPESAAREFFEDLAREVKCVCGRDLDDDTRVAIRSRAQRYLGSEDVALLNAIKGDISNQVAPDAFIHEEQLSKVLTSLQDAVRTSDQLRTVRDGVQADAIGGHPELEKAKEEIAQLQGNLRSIENNLRKFDDPLDSAADKETYGIAIIERRLADAERKLAEITKTLELKVKKELLDSILTEAQESARLRISSEICADANERVSRLLPDNQLRIKEVNKCLILDGKEGGSVGETLSVAYGFLSTLFNRTEHKIPFVVDSPAGPIDLRVRKEVAALIPKLSHQFIAFTISSEREGFLDPLEAASKRKLQYVTIFRKQSAELIKAAHKEKDCFETVDGVRVGGREFFRAFHLEKEK